MNTTWQEVLLKKDELIGGQILTVMGEATHCGQIEQVDHRPRVVSFIFTWIAHLNGSVSDPHWIALQTGKTFEAQELWPVNKIGDSEWHFIIPGSGYGRIHAKNWQGLLKPDKVRGLTC